MERLVKTILLSKSTLNEKDVCSSNDLYGDGLLDSMDIFVLIDEISAEYNIELNPIDLTRKDFKNVESLFKMIQAKQEQTTKGNN
ncbi:MAG: acyl carrier protein [Clostridiales bacterium]|jgi:acyl carrier protein|nr:acyl carrier protein [Clostridiales bacterium]